MEPKNTILIVDDNLAGRETLKGLLFGQGYNLIFANDGAEALQLADDLTPDLILLDVMMPGMDGFEVCERLRNNPKVAEVPIIMVTALDDRESRLQGIEAGADDFVSKPFDHAELRKRVQTITRLNRYRRLLAERTKFEWVVDHADDGYLIINEQDQITYTNSQARLYLNLPATSNTDYSSQTFLELAQSQYNYEPYSAWAVWPQEAEPALPRYMVRPASQHSGPFWLRVDVITMNQGEPEEYLIRLIDVSPKVAEQRSMWSFHGQVSHKLRTPLNHLFASLDMITEEDLQKVDPDIRTFFVLAKKGAIRLKDEIQDIFKYIEVTDLVRKGHAGVNLAELNNTIDRIAHELGIISCHTRYVDITDPAKHATVISLEAVELIIWELLENAKKFHPTEAPSIEIVLSIKEDKAGTMAVIEVCDDGINLSPEQLEKMWVPYYQAERYFTGQVRGTGLGLSLVTSILWGIGGTCLAHNRNQQPGIIIELKIPLASSTN